jgi:hypothetical protein
MSSGSKSARDYDFSSREALLIKQARTNRSEQSQPRAKMQTSDKLKKQANKGVVSALLLRVGSTSRASWGEAVELRCGEAGWELGKTNQSV